MAAVAAEHNAERQIESLLDCFAQRCRQKHEKQARGIHDIHQGDLDASLSRSRILKAFSARANETQTSMTISALHACLST